MMRPRTKVFVRRREVTALLVRGLSPGEIAEILQVKPQTIYNDIRYIRSGENEALYAHTRKEIFAQLHLNARERTRYLWRIVDEADSHKIKLEALRELRIQDQMLIRRLPEVLTPEDRARRMARVKQDIMDMWAAAQGRALAGQDTAIDHTKAAGLIMEHADGPDLPDSPATN